MTAQTEVSADLALEVRANLSLAFTHGLDVAMTVDCALVPRAEEVFETLDISAQPLYGGSLPRAQIDNGPWLVWPGRTTGRPAMTPIDPDADPDIAAAEMAEAMRKALEAGDETAGGELASPPTALRSAEATLGLIDILLADHLDAAPVFWALPPEADPDSFRKHLRGLNLIRLARRPRPRHPVAKGTDEVLFRHADGRMLALIGPLLRPEQVVHLLGPAKGLLALVPEGSDDRAAGLFHLTQPPEPMPRADRELLELDAPQVDALEDHRARALDRRIDAYLAAHAPAAAQMQPSDRISQVRQFRRQVYRQTSFRADAHVRDLVEILWHNGEVTLTDPKVRQILDRPGWSQERKCTALRDKMLPPAGGRV